MEDAISQIQISHQKLYRKNPDFVNFALKEFDFKAFEKFCKTVGLLLDIKKKKSISLSNETKSVTKIFYSYA